MHGENKKRVFVLWCAASLFLSNFFTSFFLSLLYQHHNGKGLPGAQRSCMCCHWWQQRYRQSRSSRAYIPGSTSSARGHTRRRWSSNSPGIQWQVGSTMLIYAHIYSRDITRAGSRVAVYHHTNVVKYKDNISLFQRAEKEFGRVDVRNILITICIAYFQATASKHLCFYRLHF